MYRPPTAPRHTHPPSSRGAAFPHRSHSAAAVGLQSGRIAVVALRCDRCDAVRDAAAGLPSRAQPHVTRRPRVFATQRAASARAPTGPLTRPLRAADSPPRSATQYNVAQRYSSSRREREENFRRRRRHRGTRLSAALMLAASRREAPAATPAAAEPAGERPAYRVRRGRSFRAELYAGIVEAAVVAPRLAPRLAQR